MPALRPLRPLRPCHSWHEPGTRWPTAGQQSVRIPIVSPYQDAIQAAYDAAYAAARIVADRGDDAAAEAVFDELYYPALDRIREEYS